MRKEIIGTEDDRTHCVNFKELNVGNRWWTVQIQLLDMKAMIEKHNGHEQSTQKVRLLWILWWKVVWNNERIKHKSEQRLQTFITVNQQSKTVNLTYVKLEANLDWEGSKCEPKTQLRHFK